MLHTSSEKLRQSEQLPGCRNPETWKRPPYGYYPPPSSSDMAATPSVGDHIERLALQRILDHLRAEQDRGRSFYTLTEISEATGLDPTTAAQAMEALEDGGPYTVEPVDAEYSEIQWHVWGSPYELDGWKSDVWNVPE